MAESKSVTVYWRGNYSSFAFSNASSVL